MAQTSDSSLCPRTARDAHCAGQTMRGGLLNSLSAVEVAYSAAWVDVGYPHLVSLTDNKNMISLLQRFN